MKPQYLTLKSKHYSSQKGNPSYVSRDDFYEEIGYKTEDLLIQNPGYDNTCAVRMSLALIKVGVPIAGRLKIKKGALTGKALEPGAKLLADQLSKQHLFGKPVLIEPADAQKKLVHQKGIVLFWKIFGYGGGHIDLVESTTANLVCHSNCHMLCKEIWFWPLH